jgi:hypothetical protein
LEIEDCRLIGDVRLGDWRFEWTSDSTRKEKAALSPAPPESGILQSLDLQLI